MKSLATILILLSCNLIGHSLATTGSTSKSACRNGPGSAGYPNATAWNALNSTVSGRLVSVVPSAKFCKSLPGGACTDAQWGSAVFRKTIPGAMNQPNWEQGYDLTPPSLCLRNGTTCGQGDVPIYSVEAQTVADIQAAVKFASTHNLRVAVKSSGHDTLGRSTAPGSLMIRTAQLQNISFTDAFFVGAENMGSAVTLGGGVPDQNLFQQAKLQGKFAVASSAATISPAGGWVQGAGHSSMSPKYGLGADNALEFQIVVASGELLQVNSILNPDLFYALRGGGAGSWGVVVSATFKTYPTFNATFSTILLTVANDTVAGALATLHAQHIFDLDPVRAGQYFWFERASTAADSASTFLLLTYLPDQTSAQSAALLAPFLNASLAIPGVSMQEQQYLYNDINDGLYSADDGVGTNLVEGSRLIPAATYQDPAKVGEVYRQLLSSGSQLLFGHIVAGGKVAENANISSAVNPAWRTAKTHILIINTWTDADSIEEIDTIRKRFQTQQLPILEQLSGPDAGAYSNEADVLEPHFETTFFGPNYAKLSEIKTKYDPDDLFIVGAGVGSERWDEWGICKV
ncbi:FAD-binding domain-containing protein [Mycena galericulata]|nr:FAD-binding domain-containing protein [Mycena galericulata]